MILTEMAVIAIARMLEEAFKFGQKIVESQSEEYRREYWKGQELLLRRWHELIGLTEEKKP